jgi:hypothetical protein
MKHAANRACFLPGLLFDPEDGVVCSFETLAYFHQTTWHYIRVNKSLQILPSWILRQFHIYVV